MRLHICHHCATPTLGALVVMPGETKPTRLDMCQSCWDWIGSPAAAQMGATMKNRIEMERQFLKDKNKGGAV